MNYDFQFVVDEITNVYDKGNYINIIINNNITIVAAPTLSIEGPFLFCKRGLDSYQKTLGQVKS